MTSEEENINGKIIIVTGANTGIGFNTALDLAKRGATIICACRDKTRTEQAIEQIKSTSNSKNVFFEELDLASLDSVRKFAKSFREKYQKLDILVNNAGVWMTEYSKTKDGFEMHFGVNHLGHFLLTNLLLDLLIKSGPSRIVNVSSELHYRGQIHWDDIMLEKNYGSLKGYAQSKLANVLFTIELKNRLQGTNVTSVSLHPGVVKTELGRNFNGCVSCLAKIFSCCLKTSEQGAQTTIYCCTNKTIPLNNGLYFSDKKVKQLNSKIANDEDAKRLWNLSAKLVNMDEK